MLADGQEYPVPYMAEQNNILVLHKTLWHKQSVYLSQTEGNIEVESIKLAKLVLHLPLAILALPPQPGRQDVLRVVVGEVLAAPAPDALEVRSVAATREKNSA